eukprot:g1342.t1
MHRSRHSSPGHARSAQDMFCSFTSIPRSPSPTKQDLYELLQRHRMHSFTRRMKVYMQDINANPDDEIPSYMRQTCSSLTKRNNTKSRSRTMSALSKEGWDSAHVYSEADKRKRIQKSLTTEFSYAYTTEDGEPQSRALSSASRLDAMTACSSELAYSAINFDKIYEEENNSPKNEHNMYSQDGNSSADAFLENSNGSETDSQFDKQTTRGASSLHKQIHNHHSRSQSTVSEDLHKDALLSHENDEQDLTCGHGSPGLPEAMKLGSSLFLEGASSSSSSSSLHLSNLFLTTEAVEDQSISNKGLHDQNQGTVSRLSGNLDNEITLWTTDSHTEDIALAEDSVDCRNNRLNQETTDSHHTLHRLFRSISSLVSTNISEESNDDEDLHQELLDSDNEFEEVSKKLYDYQKLVQTELAAQNTTKKDLASTQDLENLPNCRNTAVLEKLEVPDDNSNTIRHEALVFYTNPAKQIEDNLGSKSLVISTSVYEATTAYSDSEDDLSDTKSLLFVQSTKPRSLPELCSIARPPTADDIALLSKPLRSEAQFRDDHALILSQTQLKNKLLMKDLVHRLVSDLSSIGASSKGSGDLVDYYSSLFAPRDHYRDLANSEDLNAEVSDNNNNLVTSRLSSTSSFNRMDSCMINSRSAEQIIGEIEPADDDGASSLITSSSCIPEAATVHSSVPEGGGVTKSHITQFSRFLRGSSVHKEKKTRRRGRFHFSVKSCFGCRAASPSVLDEAESVSKTHDGRHRTR